MMRQFAISFLCVISVGAFGQFSQNGITLEYNRRHAKTPYTMPIELRFEGASTTNNISSDSKGSFVLYFDKAHPGDTVKRYDIVIGNKDYVLFNNEKIVGWTLSSQKKLEISVCRKDIIDYLISTYTNNYVQRLERELEENKNKLLKEKINANELEKKLKELDQEYQKNVNDIKARAVLFAYVDESEQDSLVLEWRDCILKNDLDEAIRIGNIIANKEVTNARLKNVDMAIAKAEIEIKKLYDLSQIIETHIQNCKAVYKHDYYTYNQYANNLAERYEQLIEIYDKLVEVYESRRLFCTDDFLYSLKVKLGKAAFDYFELTQDVLKSENVNDSEKEKTINNLLKAAEMQNPDALYKLADLWPHYNIAKECYEILLDLVRKDPQNLPSKVDDIDMLNEYYESFPDFQQENQGDTLYYKIIADNEVSLVHYKRCATDSIITIPEKIEKDNQRYKLVKIGCYIFGGMFGETSHMSIHKMESPFNFNQSEGGGILSRFVFELFRQDSQQKKRKLTELMDSLSKQKLNIKEIRLPNSIRYIGTSAFQRYAIFRPMKVNIPLSCQIIKDGAYVGCDLGEKVKLPKRLISLGDFWLPAYCTDSECMPSMEELSLPGSLKKMKLNSDYSAMRYIRKIKLAPSNKNIIMMGNSLYTSDTLSWLGGAFDDRNKENRIVYIANGAKLDALFLKKMYNENIDSVLVGPSHPLYSQFGGNIYDKNKEYLIFNLPSKSTLRLPSSFKGIRNDDPYLSNIKRLSIPKNISPKALFDVIKLRYMQLTLFGCDTLTVDFYGRKVDDVQCKDYSNLISGEECVMMGEYEKTIIPFIDSLRIDNPNDYGLYYILARLYLECKDILHAYELLEKIPNDNKYYSTINDSISTAIKDWKEQRNRAYLKGTNLRYRRTAAYDALHFSRHLYESGDKESLKDMAMMYWNIGNIYYNFKPDEENSQDDLWELVLKYYKLAINTLIEYNSHSERKNISNGYYGLSSLYYEMKDYSNALASINSAIDFDVDVDDYVLKAKILKEMNKQDEIRAIYSLIQKNYPEYDKDKSLYNILFEY